MEVLQEHLPILLPFILAEVGLMVFALVHLLKHPNVRVGNKMIWLLIILFLQFLGPILYFVIGRDENS
ncbi:MAG: PLDc N-terminal domain-containing protein [Tissierellia bacterium]|nr:PLDc N-terminal domain-containing protein [Tissierellia bacterium]